MSTLILYYAQGLKHSPKHITLILYMYNMHPLDSLLAYYHISTYDRFKKMVRPTLIQPKRSHLSVQARPQIPPSRKTFQRK